MSSLSSAPVVGFVRRALNSQLPFGGKLELTGMSDRGPAFTLRFAGRENEASAPMFTRSISPRAGTLNQILSLTAVGVLLGFLGRNSVAVIVSPLTYVDLLIVISKDGFWVVVPAGTILPHQVPHRSKIADGVAAYSWMVHISVSLAGSTTVLL